MQKILLFKILAIALLTAIIAIPLAMIQSTIDERKNFHDDAIRSIAADSVTEQTVIGPVLVIPYTDEYQELTAAVDKKAKETLVQRTIHKHLVVYPNNLALTGNIKTDQRYRGIHKVLVYTGDHKISGDFTMPPQDAFEKDKPDSKITLGQAYIAVNIDDVRGIHKIPVIQWDSEAFEFRQGSWLPGMPSGLHAPVAPLHIGNATPVSFSFNLMLDGIEKISFTPLGKNNQFTLTSNWPHPEFAGRFLPLASSRKIDQNGFSATWDISSLATNSQQQFTATILKNDQNSDSTSPTAGRQSIDSFSIGFIEPVNVYSQADRAVKYGLLFIALTFAAFFLFEVLKQLPIHPVQYALVGLALSLFFLLLISLSEQIPFAYAYLIASSACTLLNMFYLTHVLRSWKRGCGFGTALVLLYGVLFIVLQSENNALIMGSALLFGVLSAIMIATRKVDWYQVGKSAESTTIYDISQPT